MISSLTVAFGVTASQAVRTGLLLSAGGEFAFVIIGGAMAGGVLDRDVAQYMLIVAGVSMALTPFLMIAGNGVSALIARRYRVEKEVEVSSIDDDLSGHVIIAGYGRVGRTVARLLSEQMVPFVALDMSVARAQEARKSGEPVFYGDAARHDVLERVGADRAAAIVITLNDYAASTKGVASVRSKWPKLPVFVRAHDLTHSRELMELGATGIVPETLEASLQLASDVLHALGTPHDAVVPHMDRVREEGYSRVNPDVEQA